MKRFVALLAVLFTLNASALAYMPAVHEALHDHSAHGGEHHAHAEELCSVQNHLAADLAQSGIPNLRSEGLPETLARFEPSFQVFSIQSSAIPRAPPAAPVN